MMQNEETKKQDEGEWLNMRVTNACASSMRMNAQGNGEVRANTNLRKIFSCNFCRRKFYSSQALGGHQNAHRRERGLVRHYDHSNRSLGLKPHSNNIHKYSPIHGSSVAAVEAARKTSFEFEFELRQQEAANADVMWPGSFIFGQQQQQQQNWSNSDVLDLNLKL